MRTRLLIGGGAVYLKKFKKDFSEPANRIFDFLKSQNRNIHFRK